jgi:hypothetical protein
MRIRYYIGPAALGIPTPRRLTLASGTYEASPVPGSIDRDAGIGALKLTQAPGT